MPGRMLAQSSSADPFVEQSTRRGSGTIVGVILLGASFLAAIILIVLTIYLGSNLRNREEQENETRIVQSNINILSRDIARNTKDYSQWDDAVQHLQMNFDQNWTRRNIGPILDDTFGYNFSLVLDSNDRPLYGQVDGSEDLAAAADLLGSSSAKLARQARLAAKSRGGPAAGVVAAGSDLFMIAAAAITPEADSSLPASAAPPYVLLFGKRLDPDFLASLASDFGLPPLEIGAGRAPSPDLAHVDLADPTGATAAQIVWRPLQPGRDAQNWALPALAGGLLGVLIFAGVATHALRLAEALRANEARLRDFAAASPDWWWETDSAHRFVWLSRHFMQIIGVAPHLLLGRTRREASGAGPSEPRWAEHLADLAGHRPFRDFVYHLEVEPGRVRTIRVSGRPVFDRKRRFLGYRGASQDITKEWQAAENLRESEQRFRSLVENMRGIVFCHGVVGDGAHGYDERGAQIYGADAWQLAGTGGDGRRAHIDAWYDIVSDADRPAYLAAEKRRKEEGRPYTIEYRIRHPDTGAERWMREVAWLVDAPEDGRRYLGSYIIDITDEKLATLALQESELRLQLALSAGGMGTWDVDLRTGVERWNDVHYQLFGVDPQSFVPSSESFLSVVDPRDRARLQALGDDVVAGRVGPTFTNDYRIVLPYGGIRWIGGGGRLIRDADGQPSRLIGVSFDITERVERERTIERAHAQLAEQAALLAERNRELEAANQAKGRFVASVSHEIRTPMNAVLGFTDLLAGSQLNETQERYVQVIRTTGKQLLTLLNDILDMARIDAGRLDLEEVDFALADCLEQVRSLLVPQATEQGLTLTLTNHAPASLVLRGDPTRLTQILVNLVGNGIKFTAAGGVTLRVRETAADTTTSTLRFEVRDTGIGIARQRKAELFKPFSQAEKSTTRHYGGTGLGLAICQSLVNAMGGSIDVESELGQGSMFWFEIPFERGAAVIRTRASETLPTVSSRLRILIVDDVASNRELLAEVLGHQGHELLFAEDGAAAVAIAAAERLDVILMDVQMPTMDGIEATTRIRQLPPPADAVVILGLTAFAMATERARCLATGMNLCLTKPVVLSDLLAALGTVAARSRPTPATAATPAEIAPAVEGAPGQAALLDPTMLESLFANVPAAEVHGLIGRTLAWLEQACGDVAGGKESAELAQFAHRIAGTAGSFGFARLSLLARQIEERIGAGGEVDVLLAALPSTVSATRVAFGQAYPDAAGAGGTG